MKRIAKLAVAASVVALSGCYATIAERTNNIDDETARTESAYALGFSPDELTLLNRETRGGNTYVKLKSDEGVEYTCILNGGNLLTFGYINPPRCAKKGEPMPAPTLG